MIEVVVASGKGGVGKTTLSSSLAFFLHRKGYNIVAVDADVDAPNLDLVFGDGRILERNSVKLSKKAVINYRSCVNCGKCLNACRFGALMEVNGRPMVNELFCEGCGTCKIVCDSEAITMEERFTGEVIVKETGYGFPLITGELKLGEHNSGKLVSLVKAIGRSYGRKYNSEIMVIDAAPGIGCPVIASISGANYVLAVTEPTLTAKEDLIRLIKLINHFKIPFGIVVNNRSGTLKCVALKFKSRIEQDLGFEVLGLIPYDEEIFRSASLRKPILEYKSDSIASKSIETIFEKMLETISIK